MESFLSHLSHVALRWRRREAPQARGKAPGPGAYNLPEPFGRGKITIRRKGDALPHLSIPGPGEYLRISIFFFAQGNVCFGTYSPRSILFRGMRSPSSRPGPASALVQPGKGPGYRQSSRRSRRGLSVRKEWFSMVFRFSSIFPQHFSRPFFLFVRSMFVETHNLPSGGHCIDSDTG